MYLDYQDSCWCIQRHVLTNFWIKSQMNLIHNFLKNSLGKASDEKFITDSEKFSLYYKPILITLVSLFFAGSKGMFFLTNLTIINHQSNPLGIKDWQNIIGGFKNLPSEKQQRIQTYNLLIKISIFVKRKINFNFTQLIFFGKTIQFCNQKYFVRSHIIKTLQSNAVIDSFVCK